MTSRALLVTALVLATACSEQGDPATAGTDAGAKDATSADGPVSDAADDAAPTSIKASDYDQSCTVRRDCAGIEEGSLCGCGALNAAINVGDLAKEQADAKERSANCAPQTGTCGAATATVPVCVNGRCALFDCRADTCPDEGGDGGDCASDRDCGGNMLCIGGRCEAACADQSQCAAGQCNVGSGTCLGPPGCNPPAPYPEGGCAAVCYGYCVEGADAGSGDGASE